MKAINLDKEDVTLFFDTRIYKLDSIMEAANDFTESCWVNIDSDVKDKVLVKITPKTSKIELDNLGFEFFNYVLGLMHNESA